MSRVIQLSVEDYQRTFGQQKKSKGRQFFTQHQGKALLQSVLKKKPEYQLLYDVIEMLKISPLVNAECFFTAQEVSNPSDRYLHACLGKRSGVADLLILIRGGRVAFMELKPETRKVEQKTLWGSRTRTIGGSLTPAQREFKRICDRLGIPCFLAKTKEQAVDAFKQLGVMNPNYQERG